MQNVRFLGKLAEAIFVAEIHCDLPFCEVFPFFFPCGGSVVAHQTSGAGVPGSNPACVPQ